MNERIIRTSELVIAGITLMILVVSMLMLGVYAQTSNGSPNIAGANPTMNPDNDLDESNNLLPYNRSHTTTEVNKNPVPNNLISSDLKVQYHVFGMPPMSCDKGVNSTHLLTLTDIKGNTVDIYCERNPLWTNYEGQHAYDRQFRAYYNKDILVGLCPWDYGMNSWTVLTDPVTKTINQTTWLSVAPNGSSVTYHNEFNTYNKTAWATDGLPPYTAEEASLLWLNPRNVVEDRIMGVNN